MRGDLCDRVRVHEEGQSRDAEADVDVARDEREDLEVDVDRRADFDLDGGRERVGAGDGVDRTTSGGTCGEEEGGDVLRAHGGLRIRSSAAAVSKRRTTRSPILCECACERLVGGEGERG